MYHLCNWCVPRPLLGDVVDKKSFASSRVNILQPPALCACVCLCGVCACVCVCVRVQFCVCVYTHTCICIYVCIYIYRSIQINMYIYIYIILHVCACGAKKKDKIHDRLCPRALCSGHDGWTLWNTRSFWQKSPIKIELFFTRDLAIRALFQKKTSKSSSSSKEI